jgi:DNA-binding CsgD family transcriptional regulator
VVRKRDAIGRFAEACIGASESTLAWCEELARVAVPLFESRGGIGSTVCLFAESGITEAAVGHDPLGALVEYEWTRAVEAMRPVLGFDERAPFEHVAAECARRLSGFRTGLMSRRFGKTTLRGVMDRMVGLRTGVRDAVLVRAGGRRAAILATALLDRAWDARDWALMRTMQRHMQRSAPAHLDGLTPDRADAVVEPGKGILALRGAASAEAIGAAVKALERARAGKDPHDQAERIWEEVLKGEWSFFEHIESDGKRLLLLRRNGHDGDAHERLTPAEGEVVGRSRRGLSNKRIALELGVTETTVSAHLAAALGKLGFASPAELIAWMPRS